MPLTDAGRELLRGYGRQIGDEDAEGPDYPETTVGQASTVVLTEEWQAAEGDEETLEEFVVNAAAADDVGAIVEVRRWYGLPPLE